MITSYPRLKFQNFLVCGYILQSSLTFNLKGFIVAKESSINGLNYLHKAQFSLQTNPRLLLEVILSSLLKSLESWL